MKQVNSIISTYSADVFGAISALFELGGMIVVHDPSGCNSTYTTHDEPRWFDSKTLLYISGLTEQDAILGNDRKFIDEVTETALLQKPRFVALLSAQMPAMLGIDLRGIARVIEKNTKIPTFSLPTNSMRDYSIGISLALKKLADMITEKIPKVEEKPDGVNILGLTPLDFAINGTDKAIVEFFEENDVPVVAKFAMGSDLDELFKASKAKMNVVVSYGGLAAAKAMEKAWGTPYIVGLPVGRLKEKLLKIIKHNQTSILYTETQTNAPGSPEGKALWRESRGQSPLAGLGGAQQKRIYLIHESIVAASLAAAIEEEIGDKITVVAATSTEKVLMREGDEVFEGEKELKEKFQSADLIVADPMYQAIAGSTPFIPLPHIAFSGRTYQRSIVNFVKDFERLAEKIGEG